MRRAYPVYDETYQEAVATLRTFLDAIPNLQTIGRNGQHRYNNQDHSMLTGIYAARNLAGADHDVWAVNVEKEYVESDAAPGRSTGDRLVPRTADEPDLREIVETVFARYDPVALGIAVGSVCGLGLFLVTAFILIRGVEGGVPQLSLLSHYLVGYRITWMGALIGALEALLAGFVYGVVLARSINLLVGWTEARSRRQLQMLEIDPLEGSPS